MNFIANALTLSLLLSSLAPSLAEGADSGPLLAASKKDESCATYLQKKQKNRRLIARPDCEETPETPADEDHAVTTTPVTKGGEDTRTDWFPDWQPDSFSWFLYPIVGFMYHDETLTDAKTGESIRTRTGQTEFGLGGGLNGIPAMPMNPGFTLGVAGQYAVGGEEAVSDSRGSDYNDARSHYNRYYVETSIQALYRWYRNELTIGQGMKTSTQDKPKIDDNVTKIGLFHLVNDSGFLLRPTLATHVTYAYDKAYWKSWGKVLFSEHDVWLHLAWFPLGRVFQSDIGPGSSWVTEYKIDANDSSVKLGSGNHQYLRWLMVARPFWRLFAKSDYKYILTADDKGVGNYATLLLPDQDLYAMPRTFLPKNSYTWTAMAGVEKLFFGIGVGYQYNLISIAKNKKQDRPAQKSTDTGFVIFYNTSI